MGFLMNKVYKAYSISLVFFENNITEMYALVKHLREKVSNLYLKYEQILLTSQIVSTVRHQEGEGENRAKGKVKVAGL